MDSVAQDDDREHASFLLLSYSWETSQLHFKPVPKLQHLALPHSLSLSLSLLLSLYPSRSPSFFPYPPLQRILPRVGVAFWDRNKRVPRTFKWLHILTTGPAIDKKGRRGLPEYKHKKLRGHHDMSAPSDSTTTPARRGQKSTATPLLVFLVYCPFPFPKHTLALLGEEKASGIHPSRHTHTLLALFSPRVSLLRRGPPDDQPIWPQSDILIILSPRITGPLTESRRQINHAQTVPCACSPSTPLPLSDSIMTMNIPPVGNSWVWHNYVSSYIMQAIKVHKHVSPPQARRTASFPCLSPLDHTLRGHFYTDRSAHAVAHESNE
ncbi:uncharacterized protein CTRU02_211104 [Colletotrichum truncatum]|uniref:Uncharacterized protein n=1 Tax=Colletotrichum truncatum TaxID=5467 RepID=A0ACC3YQW9_COLTU|nr:uncharacterized protein CTRU02_01883 [Colletotrichum truncatum]KAF6799012.1 hypothetical protein CTRU02_01883 [Colletotrichum truncatum]